MLTSLYTKVSFTLPFHLSQKHEQSFYINDDITLASPLLSVCHCSLSLVPSDLLARIGEATKPDGTVEQIGHILVNWVRE